MTKTLRSLARILKYGRIPQKASLNLKTSDKCFVLGNGPSLAADLDGNLDIISSADVFCVNRFAESPLYTAIRPNYYVFADPSHWVEDVSENLRAMRENLYDVISKNTTWPMKIMVPFQGENFFKNVFSTSPHIEIFCYNNVPLYGNQFLIHKLYDWGLGNPTAQTVLIAALYLAIRHEYKNIVLLGADHSWHETLVLDGANRVCMRDKHFYDKDAKLVPWGTGRKDGELFTMPALFAALAKMFEGHWEINAYAEYRGASILNASSKTYVDAYKRAPLRS